MVKRQKGVGLFCIFTILFFIHGCTSANPVHTNVNRAKGDGKLIVSITETLIGSPYRFGGDTPRGFDCSGLVHYVYNQVGIEVPRSSRMLHHKAKKVPVDKLQPGDLLFFKINGKTVSHVAIYSKNGQFIHAPSSGKTVSTASLNSRYWSVRFAGAGRFL